MMRLLLLVLLALAETAAESDETDDDDVMRDEPFKLHGGRVGGAYEPTHLSPTIFHDRVRATLQTIECEPDCECDVEDLTMTCSGASLQSVPARIPSPLDVLVIRNASSLYTIPRQSFRKMDRLREVRFVHCPRLETIEKFAFKGLRRLRQIAFDGCPSLTELAKGAFSGILNEEGLRIIFTKTPIRNVHSGAFRNSHKLREVSISGDSLHIHRHAFSSINELDFLTISGVARLDQHIFTNSSRFYIVHLHDSNTEIPPNAFSSLAHVHQILIQRSRLSLVAPEAFAGISTVETLELFDNRIGILAPHAFAGAENIGRVRVARNAIAHVDSPEAVLSAGAAQLRLEDNTVACSCRLKWMGAHPDPSIVDSNHCGEEGVHRSVRAFLRFSCYSAEASLLAENLSAGPRREDPDPDCKATVFPPASAFWLALFLVLRVVFLC